MRVWDLKYKQISCRLSSILLNLKRVTNTCSQIRRPSGCLYSNMYHDLNVRIAGDRRSQALNDLYCFGYDVVAFTTEVKGTSQLIPAVCPERKTQKWCPLNEHPLKVSTAFSHQ